MEYTERGEQSPQTDELVFSIAAKQHVAHFTYTRITKRRRRRYSEKTRRRQKRKQKRRTRFVDGRVATV